MNSLASSSRQAVRAALAAGLALVLLLIPFASAGNAAGSTQKVVSGTLTWGVKESFRTYLTGFAEGKVTASDGARLDSANVPTFDKGQGTLDAGKGAISYKGKVRYYGYAGVLDFTLIDPKLILDPAGKGHLEVGYQVGSGKPKRLNIVDITPGALTFSGKNGNLKGRTYLTKAGMEVFSYQGHPFYTENLELDQITTSVTLDAAGAPPVTPPSSPAPSSSSTPAPKSSATSPAPSKPSTTPAQPAPSKPASTPAQGTSSASLTWGVKESFRTYIAGPIANGRITVSGHASASGGGFTFPQTSTTAKPPSAAGTTNYTGSVNFYGHDGILNLTFSNPRVVIPSSGNTGQLVVDYAQNGSAKGSLTIASLNLAGGSKTASASGVSYRGVPASLTEQGTGVFSYQGHGFYPAGIALDPVTFTVGAANAKVTGSSGPSVVTSQVSTPSSTSSTKSDKGDTAPPVSAAAAANASKQGEGVLLWGVRSSFRSYILGPIAHGSITISGGASNAGNAWAFPQSGTKSSDGGASYRGSVKFYGHDGILNLTFSDPAIRMTSANSAALSVSVNGKRADMVNLDLSSAAKTSDSGATTYTGAPATLTAAGANVFSYQGHAFYPTGSPMDPVTFTVGAVSHKSGGASTTSTSTSLSSSASASASTSGGSQGQSASPKVALPDLTCPATGTDITWGFKESFRSYIDGSIANGDWTTKDGATYTTPNFIWTKGSGKFSKDGTQGLVKFPGSVHFTGHDGALDTTIANPTLEFTGDHTYLRLDAKSTLMDAALKGKTQWVERDNSRFVELDTSRISVTKKGSQSIISGQNVPTKLTGEGAIAFPNYTAGTAMDPMTFELTTGSNCATAKSASSATASPKSSASHPSVPTQAASASRGHDTNMAPWVGAGALGLLAVGGAAAVARRRSHAGASTNNSHTPEDAE